MPRTGAGPLEAGPRSRSTAGALLGVGALDGRGTLADLDLDAARLALLGLGDPDLEDALFEGRDDLLGVDALGQTQRAAELARRALDADVALALLGRLGRALTARW